MKKLLSIFAFATIFTLNNTCYSMFANLARNISRRYTPSVRSALKSSTNPARWRYSGGHRYTKPTYRHGTNRYSSMTKRNMCTDATKESTKAKVKTRNTAEATKPKQQAKTSSQSTEKPRAKKAETWGQWALRWLKGEPKPQVEPEPKISAYDKIKVMGIVATPALFAAATYGKFCLPEDYQNQLIQKYLPKIMPLVKNDEKEEEAEVVKVMKEDNGQKKAAASPERKLSRTLSSEEINVEFTSGKMTETQAYEIIDIFWNLINKRDFNGLNETLIELFHIYDQSYLESLKDIVNKECTAIIVEMSNPKKMNPSNQTVAEMYETTSTSICATGECTKYKYLLGNLQERIKERRRHIPTTKINFESLPDETKNTEQMNARINKMKSGQDRLWQERLKNEVKDIKLLINCLKFSILNKVEEANKKIYQDTRGKFWGHTYTGILTEDFTSENQSAVEEAMNAQLEGVKNAYAIVKGESMMIHLEEALLMELKIIKDVLDGIDPSSIDTSSMSKNRFKELIDSRVRDLAL